MKIILFSLSVAVVSCCVARGLDLQCIRNGKSIHQSMAVEVFSGTGRCREHGLRLFVDSSHLRMYMMGCQLKWVAMVVGIHELQTHRPLAFVCFG